jgi:hypothetical protein
LRLTYYKKQKISGDYICRQFEGAREKSIAYKLGLLEKWRRDLRESTEKVIELPNLKKIFEIRDEDVEKEDENSLWNQLVLNVSEPLKSPEKKLLGKIEEKLVEVRETFFDGNQEECDRFLDECKTSQLDTELNLQAISNEYHARRHTTKSTWHKLVTIGARPRKTRQAMINLLESSGDGEELEEKPRELLLAFLETVLLNETQNNPYFSKESYMNRVISEKMEARRRLEARQLFDDENRRLEYDRLSFLSVMFGQGMNGENDEKQQEQAETNTFEKYLLDKKNKTFFNKIKPDLLKLLPFIPKNEENKGLRMKLENEQAGVYDYASEDLSEDKNIEAGRIPKNVALAASLPEAFRPQRVLSFIELNKKQLVVELNALNITDLMLSKQNANEEGCIKLSDVEGEDEKYGNEKLLEEKEITEFISKLKKQSIAHQLGWLRWFKSEIKKAKEKMPQVPLENNDLEVNFFQQKIDKLVSEIDRHFDNIRKHGFFSGHPSSVCEEFFEDCQSMYINKTIDLQQIVNTYEKSRKQSRGFFKRAAASRKRLSRKPMLELLGMYQNKTVKEQWNLLNFLHQYLLQEKKDSRYKAGKSFLHKLITQEIRRVGAMHDSQETQKDLTLGPLANLSKLEKGKEGHPFLNGLSNQNSKNYQGKNALEALHSCLKNTKSHLYVVLNGIVGNDTSSQNKKSLI